MLRPDVPFMNSNLNAASRVAFLRQAQEAQAARVWISLDRSSLFDREDHMKRLEDNLRFFEQNGMETGVWIQAFGFGDPLSYKACGWTRLRSVTGKEKEMDAFCPEDPDFTAAYLAWVADIAKLSPALIMLDDDLCLSVRPGIGCFCDRHRKLLQQEVGELPDLPKIFTGGKNKYRDAWYRVMGNTLRTFCRRVREAVDKVDPTIRMGFCAGYTSWDIEGTDPIELARILAGGTRPFYRLTAAPYWVATNRFPGMRLSAIIENARNQIEWSRAAADIEIFAEADSYPRPCYHTPAMLMENFDIAMHAAGIKSLKYLFDYYSSPSYETQYQRIHVRNLPLYEAVEDAFRDTTPCGIKVYRPPHRITEAVLPKAFVGEKPVMRSYFSKAAAMLARHAIPVAYGESEYAVVFGDDALYFDGKPKRVVLDRAAALLLQEKGVDVGFTLGAEAPHPTFEIFENERVLLQGIDGEATFFDLCLKDGATVQSRFDAGAVASFTYGNFLILNFDAFTVGEASTLYGSYARGAQLQKFFGFPYPAVCGHADLYAICAERENEHVMLLQNLSIDPVFDFDIRLPRPCRRFRLIGGEGTLSGDRIRVTTDLAPQATLLLTVGYE